MQIRRKAQVDRVNSRISQRRIEVAILADAGKVKPLAGSSEVASGVREVACEFGFIAAHHRRELHTTDGAERLQMNAPHESKSDDRKTHHLNDIRP